MRADGQEINVSNYKQQTTRGLERALYFCELGQRVKKEEAIVLIPLLKDELKTRYVLEERILNGTF